MCASVCADLALHWFSCPGLLDGHRHLAVGARLPGLLPLVQHSFTKEAVHASTPAAQAPSPASARILILTVCPPAPPRPTCLQVLWYKKFSCDVGNCPTAVVLNWYPAYRCVEVRRNQPSGSFVFERVRGAHVSGGLQGVRGACNIYSTSYFGRVSWRRLENAQMTLKRNR